jgi:hypothetical protein
MVPLSTNAVALFNSVGFIYSTVVDGLINAQGFYYSPLGGAVTAVASSVSRAEILKKSIIVLGPFAKLIFDKINVNMQNVWNTTTSEAIISVAGIYLVDLTLYLSGSCTGSYDKIKGWLVVLSSAKMLHTC